MSSSYFGLIRRLKDSNAYARELAKQFAMFRSISDQVDNPIYKAYNKLKNYRLVLHENPTIAQGPAGSYRPGIPPEGWPPIGVPPPETGPQTDAKFSYNNSAITAIGAITDRPASNVNDGRLDTSWSYGTLPAWIRFDLGAVKRVAFVRVAWHRGDERTYGYSIETSNSSGSGYVVRRTGTTSGTSTGFEHHGFTDINAQFVQIRVTSNSQSAFAGISEVEIWGGNTLASPPPPPGPPGSPPPPGPPPPPPATPIPTGTISLQLNFSNSLDDASGFNNHALVDGMTAPRYAPAATTALGNSLDLNPITGTTSQQQTLQTNRITYYGGPVLNKYKVQVWNIFWGAGWDNTEAPAWFGGTIDGPALRTAIIDGMNTIASSDHFKGLWSYASQPGIVIGGNITHTATALPGSSGSNIPSSGFGEGVGAQAPILACRTAGLVPNWDNYGETITDKDGNKLVYPTGFEGRMDYRHIYFVHIDPSRKNLVGTAGTAWRGFTPGSSVNGQTIWYNYNALQVTQAQQGWTSAQWHQQGWAHELFHLIGEGPGLALCTPGYTGFNWNHNGECGWIQHAMDSLCGSNLVLLQGTQVLTQHYWSDIDGKCIAPGSGESWTRAPGG